MTGVADTSGPDALWGGGATLQVVVLDGEVGSCAHKKVPLVVEAHELWYGSYWEFQPCSLMASLPGCSDHTSWFSCSVDAFAKDCTLPVVLTHICKHVVWVEITHSAGCQITKLPKPCFLHVEHGGEGLEPLSTCFLCTIVLFCSLHDVQICPIFQ